MKKTLAILVTAILFLVTVGSSPAAADRSDNWGTLADQAIAKFEAMDTGGEQAHAYAYIMGAIARRSGWNDPRIATYLAKLYTLRNPDGGWGLNFTHDKFNDGTINPANTTYTVTLADHLGPVMLDGYKAGVIPYEIPDTILHLIVTTQTMAWTTQGKCVAFSRSPNDAVNASNDRCVHNVNAEAVWYIQAAVGAGFLETGAQRRAADLSKGVMSFYNYQGMYWSYRGDDLQAAPQDFDHHGATIATMYESGLNIPVSSEAGYQAMITTSTYITAPVTHMRLTGMPGSPGRIVGNTTQWCVLGDNWLTEAQNFINSPPYPIGVRLAQSAYWSARNSGVC